MTLEDTILLILSVLGIFTTIIIITRIFGLRTFAKMSSFDFASTIAVGSVLASVILNKDYSLLKGGIALVSIIAFQTLFSYFVRKFSWFKRMFTNQPQIIMWNGRILPQNMKRCNIGKNDLIAKLREANVHDFNEVKAVVFESTGDISVIHNTTNRDFNPALLQDVQRDSLS